MINQRFNEMNRNIDQLRTQLSQIDAEVDRVEGDHRRALDEAKNKIRTLKAAVRDAVDFCDEVRQSIAQVQREVPLGAEHPGYGAPLGAQPPINAQQLAWELTQVITRALPQAFAAGGNAGRIVQPQS